MEKWQNRDHPVIPRTWSFAGETYTINYSFPRKGSYIYKKENWEEFEINNWDGCVCFNSKNIYIKNLDKTEGSLNILIHEALHACYPEFRHKRKLDKSKDLVYISAVSLSNRLWEKGLRLKQGDKTGNWEEYEGEIQTLLSTSKWKIHCDKIRAICDGIVIERFLWCIGYRFPRKLSLFEKIRDRVDNLRFFQ